MITEPRICQCDHCVRVSPAIKAIDLLLPDHLKVEFQNIVSKMLHAEDDAEYYKLRSTGEWPGCEWIKDGWVERNTGNSPAAPKFQNVSCSQCGQEFGPGDQGFSHCEDHNQDREVSK